MKSRLLVAVSLVLALAGGGVVAQGQGTQGNGQGTTQRAGEFEQWKADLERVGPEAAEARLAAIENLLSMLDLRAHTLLQEKLRKAPGPDSLHEPILTAVGRRVRTGDRAFSVGDEQRELRQQILRAWVPTLASFWLQPDPLPAGTSGQATNAQPEPFRDLARACITRWPVRELEEGLRAVMALPTQDVAMKVAALWTAADSQNLYLAPFLADQYASDDARVRVAARAALRLLTLQDAEFATAEQFKAWFQQNGNRRYLDLAEQAARAADGRVQRLQQEYRQRLLDGVTELMLALADPRAGVDWAAVQARVLLDDPPGTMDACLERLRVRLQDDVHTENHTAQRQAFHKALLDELGRLGTGNPRRRALLLENAAFLLRPDGALSADMEKLLVQHLDSSEPLVATAAIRGLARFPTASSRAGLVKNARAALELASDASLERVRAILRTLGRRANPTWRAPAPNDADKAEWLALIRAVFDQAWLRPLRADAMTVALLTDPNGERVPEVFDTLLALAQDPQQDYELRSTSLIHLKDFLGNEARADAFVRQVAGLLADTDKEIRLFAANRLSQLPDHADAKRREWVLVVLQAARDRALVEPDPGVLRALVATMSACARPPGSADQAIGSIILVLEGIGFPVPADQQFRIAPLLAALTAIAAEPMTDPAPWLSACRVLQQHEQRPSLRHVLQSQHAARLAPDVASTDAGLAQRARLAMHFLIQAALHKPPKDSWTSPDLKAEASDVRSALVALDGIDADLDAAPIRLMRLEILTALGAPQEVLQWGGRWLAADFRPKNGQALSPEQRDQVRLQVADAHIALQQFDKAGAMLEQVDPSRQGDAFALTAAERLGKALLDGGNAGAALPWLQKALDGSTDKDARCRSRVLLVAQARLQAEPAGRADVLTWLETKAPLFEAADCPADQRDAFTRLRGQGQ